MWSAASHRDLSRATRSDKDPSRGGSPPGGQPYYAPAPVVRKSRKWRWAVLGGLDFVYLENDRGALYLELPADVDRYQTIFTQLTAVDLSSSETRKFLATVSGGTGERE